MTIAYIWFKIALQLTRRFSYLGSELPSNVVFAQIATDGAFAIIAAMILIGLGGKV